MTTLDHWPTKADDPPNQLLQFLDGEVYRFGSTEIEDLGYYGEDGTATATATPYRLHNALFNLRNDLMLVSRTEHGPWQSRSKMIDDGRALVFQFTGPQECRSPKCETISDPNGKGYCEVHKQ